CMRMQEALVCSSPCPYARCPMTADLQSAKKLVRSYHESLAGATPQSVEGILAAHTSPDWHWRGMHPFHEQRGAAAVATIFWRPYLAAMTRVQRRPDI